MSAWLPFVSGGAAVAGGGRGGRAAAGVAAVLSGLLLFVMLPLVTFAGVLGGIEKACEAGALGNGTVPTFPAGSGNWLSTSYGPPWNAMEGTGVTATGTDLRPARPAYVIAVDPALIPLGSLVHARPNPFGDPRIVFVADDTGGAILGRHIDFYDWRGREFQEGWGRRQVDVDIVRAADDDRGTPAPSEFPSAGEQADACAQLDAGGAGPLRLSPGDRARILPDGSATAPESAPPEIKDFIQAANQIHRKPYVYGGGHGASLAAVQPSYDCSSSTSFALHHAGMLDSIPRVSGDLESWGAPGPGRWLTVYANEGHVFSIVAGLSFNTAHYGVTIPAGSGPRWSPDITGQLASSSFVVRHWPRL
ncbi:3D domain-containing protein [Conexibacter sp. CPCC 206217]|uniref:3D domain-containing protein n=1 Tax=Conexibacter sp. CPCC 206217 TaxID=3064574 RepID=UPI002721C92B|nr:3D domain-containing protein [Conexibacter sp. CPCC 206217]MDO8208992.1 3D domain-containing protein [Conexibacter sp. CPCC 206217]